MCRIFTILWCKNKSSKILNDMAKAADSSFSKKITKNYYIKTSVLHLRSNCTPFASQLYPFYIAKGVQLECKCSTFVNHWPSVCYKSKNRKGVFRKIITKQAANLRLKFHCSPSSHNFRPSQQSLHPSLSSHTSCIQECITSTSGSEYIQYRLANTYSSFHWRRAKLCYCVKAKSGVKFVLYPTFVQTLSFFEEKVVPLQQFNEILVI